MSLWWDRANAQLCGVCGEPNDRSVARNVCPTCYPARHRRVERVMSLGVLLIAVGVACQAVALLLR